MGLLRKLALFVVINAAIAAAAASAPRGFTSGAEYQRERVVFDYVRSAQPGDRMSVIVGDSRAECCIAARPIGFVNLSLSGSTPVEGYYVLRELYAQGAEVERLIIAYSPFTVFGQKTFYSRTRYFGLVDHQFIDEVQHKVAEFGDVQYQRYYWRALEVIDETLPWLPDDAKFAVVNVLSLDQILWRAWRHLREVVMPTPRGPEMVADPRFKLHEAISSRAINSGTASAEYTRADDRSPVNGYYLRALVELARRHHTALWFQVMPFDADVLQPGPEYFQRFERVIDDVGLTDCYSGVDYWPNQLFADPTHLNQRGVDRFSAELPQRLRFCEG